MFWFDKDIYERNFSKFEEHTSHLTSLVGDPEEHGINITRYVSISADEVLSLGGVKIKMFRADSAFEIAKHRVVKLDDKVRNKKEQYIRLYGAKMGLGLIIDQQSDIEYIEFKSACDGWFIKFCAPELVWRI